MSDNSNKKDKKLDFDKVEEAITEYSTEKTYGNIEEHPLFIKVIENQSKTLLKEKDRQLKK